jgi:hypothetical protein
MMRATFRSMRSLAMLVAVGTVLAACSDDPTAPAEHGPTPVNAELYLRGSDIKLADTHGDHWHGSVTTGVGVNPELDVRFLDEDGNTIELDDEHTVHAEIAAGQPSGIATVESHGDHLGLTALAPGETRIVIHFRHDGHTEWSTPALRVVVTTP